MSYIKYMAVFLIGLTVTATTATARIAVGEEAPMTDVKMMGVDGNEVSIADVAGEHGTLVIFSCNHCPWVKAWEDRISAIGNAYQKKGFGVIVINANDPGRVPEDDITAMKVRAKGKGFEFPYVVDATSNVARAFGATKTPEVFLFNAEGKLTFHGAIDDDAKNPDEVEAHYLRNALDALLAGESVLLSETKAIGCSIKFRPGS